MSRLKESSKRPERSSDSRPAGRILESTKLQRCSDAETCRASRNLNADVMAGLPLLCHHFYASKLVDPSRHVVFRPMVSRAAVRLLHRAVRLLPGKRTPHARKRTPRPEKRTPQPEKRPPQQEKRTPRQAPLFKAFPFFEASFAANSLLQGFSSPSQVTPSFFKASTPSSDSYPFFQGLYFPFSGSYPFFQGLYFLSSGSYPFFLSDAANSSLFQGSTFLFEDNPIFQGPYFPGSGLSHFSRQGYPFFQGLSLPLWVLSLFAGPLLFFVRVLSFFFKGSPSLLQGPFFVRASTSLLHCPVPVCPAAQRTPPFFKALLPFFRVIPLFRASTSQRPSELLPFSRLYFPSTSLLFVSVLSFFSGPLLPFFRVLSFFPATQRTPPFFRASFSGLYFPSSGLSPLSGPRIPLFGALSFFSGPQPPT